jgi:acetyl esterase/lipase
MDEQLRAELAAIGQMVNAYNVAVGHNGIPFERQLYDQSGLGMGFPPGLQVETVYADGLEIERLTPAGAETDRAILYLHGGGFCIGSPRSHRSMVAAIASAAGCVAYVPNYRLAPEHPFPAALEDAAKAFEFMREAGVPESRTVFAGDSAGGGLALVAAMAHHALGLPEPSGLVLLSPWADLTNSGPSYGLKANVDMIVKKSRLNEMASAYAGEAFTHDAAVSPLMGDFTGLPPIYVQVGSEEILLSDSIRIAEQAGLTGVTVSLEVWPHLPHVFHFFHPILRPARAAIERVGGFIRHHQSLTS